MKGVKRVEQIKVSQNSKEMIANYLKEELESRLYQVEEMDYQILI